MLPELSIRSRRYTVGLLLLLSTWANPLTAAADAFRLRTEFSKNPIYEGETVTVKFVLYGTANFIDAEVAKFPEFRGFWTQNHVLRQGPLPLVPERRDGMLNEALVGSYTITPMMGKRDLEIIPMKMILRTYDQFQSRSPEPGLEMLSEQDPLKVLPLPPVPPDLKDYFTGAVGWLSLQLESPTLYFHPDEPVTLRVLARGQANFADVSDLPLPTNDRVHRISRRTVTDATLPPSKIFEYTLAVREAKPLDLPEIKMAFFDPVGKRYQVATTDSVHLEPQPAPPLDAIDIENFGLPLGSEQIPFRWRLSVSVWVVQALFLGLLLGILGGRWRTLWVSRLSYRWGRFVHEQQRHIQGSLDSGNPLASLRQLQGLWDKARFFLSRNQAHLKTSKNAEQERVWIKEHWDRTFAPPGEQPPLPDTARLRKSLRAMLKGLTFWR